MAPFITATIQLLLASVRTTIRPHDSAEQSLACHHTHDKTIDSLSTGGRGLAVVSWGFNRMDVFGEDLNSGSINHKYWDGYQWGPSVQALEYLGGNSSAGGSPGAISRNQSLIDIFRVNSSRVLTHKFYDGTAWKPSVSDWDVLVDYLPLDLEKPATCSWGPDRMDVFAQQYGSDCLVHTYYDGTIWKPGEDDDPEVFCGVQSGAAAVSWGPNRIDVFAVTPDFKLAHLYWDGSKWSDWEDLIGDFFASTTPAAVTWSANRFDVFAVNQSGNLIHVYWDGSQYNNEDLGTGNGEPFTGTPSVTTWDVGRFDIMALAEDSQYYYKYYDGDNWSSWYPKGFAPDDDDFISSPATVSWGKDRLDIWGVTDSNKLAHQTWYGSGWYPGPNTWEILGGSLSA